MKRLIPLVLFLAGVSSGWALTAFPGGGGGGSGSSSVALGDSISGAAAEDVFFGGPGGTLAQTSTFTLTGTGFFGVGIASPLFRLHVVAPGGSSEVAKFESTSGASQIRIDAAAGNNTVGTRYFVGGSEQFETSYTPQSPARLYYEFAETEIMAINATGLGIGTTNPSSKLVVNNGDIKISTTTGSRGVIFQDGTTQTIAMPNGTKLRQLTVVLDGGGVEIATGTKNVFIRISSNITLTGWDIVADQTGSIVVDFWKDTYANFPPDVSDTFAGAEKPTLSSAIKAQDTSLSSMTTSLSAGDYIEVNVESVTDVTKVIISLYGVVN